jgi:deoxycytidine triphosphate deaminase
VILPAQEIRRRSASPAPMIWPFVERDVVRGMSFGLSAASYDIRIAESMTVHPGEFVLASTIERFCIPDDVLIVAHDKSSWARRGLLANRDENLCAECFWTRAGERRVRLTLADLKPCPVNLFHLACTRFRRHRVRVF